MTLRSSDVPFNDNRFVVAYYRYSSSSQNEASIDQQRQMVKRWIDSEGLTLAAEYADAAKTGTNTDREDFQRMMVDLPKLKPAYLVVWKNDRIGRDRYDLAFTKRSIRAMGIRIKYIEGISPSDDPESALTEAISDGFAEYYSRQLSANIKRGVHYNAQNALYNGKKIFGYGVDSDKKYIRDEVQAPIVAQIFADYIGGISSAKIAEGLNTAGVRTMRGKLFTAKTIGKILKNRAYIGEYSHSGYVIPGGMPQLVSQEDWEAAQKKLTQNRHRGAKTTTQIKSMGSSAPDYWLTGTGCCELCGAPLEGVSGTSKTGRKYRYYYCLNQRKKKCTMKPVRKDVFEDSVTRVIEAFLDDTESLASLAVDLAAEYKAAHGRGDELLKSLEAERRDVERQLANFVKAVAQGLLSATIVTAIQELEQRQDELTAAIQKENVKSALYEDEASIGAFFQRYAKAKLDDTDTRAMLLEYFVDKIYVGDGTLTVVSWFYNHGERITWEELVEARKARGHAELVREFDMTPLCGDGEN